MGIVNFGIPEKETEWLRDSMNLRILVEGGTYTGGTALSSSRFFQTVYTIEKSDVMFETAKQRLANVANICQLQGDTREHLPSIISKNDNILFWLDAHWSGGQTYGNQDECPLLEELEIIFNSTLKNFAILIDDARLFLAPPPLPHDFKNWPSIKEICQAVPDGFDVIVQDDVIYIVPSHVKMLAYTQEKTTSDWLKYAESSRLTMKNCIKSALRSIFDNFVKK